MYCSLLKDSERKKSIANTEKDGKIAEFKKANKKLEDQIKKLTNEKTNLGEQRDSLQIEVCFASVASAIPPQLMTMTVMSIATHDTTARPIIWSWLAHVYNISNSFHYPIVIFHIGTSP